MRRGEEEGQAICVSILRCDVRGLMRGEREGMLIFASRKTRKMLKACPCFAKSARSNTKLRLRRRRIQLRCACSTHFSDFFPDPLLDDEESKPCNHHASCPAPGNPACTASSACFFIRACRKPTRSINCARGEADSGGITHQFDEIFLCVCSNLGRRP